MKGQTWNPVTGCNRISPGCDRCFALNRAALLKENSSRRYQLDGDPRTSGPGFGLTLQPDKLDDPYHWRNPRSVFVNSMSDIFHQGIPISYVQKIFAVIEDTPQHNYFIITKRSKRMMVLAPKLPWPPNLQMTVTIENQQYAFRADHLRQVPAAMRTINAEPLLGLIDNINLEGIDGVNAGGETEPGFRECKPEWVRALRDQCIAAGVPFSFSHWSGLHPGDNGRLLDGKIWDQHPRPLHPLFGRM
jgi:protein gp37